MSKKIVWIEDDISIIQSVIEQTEDAGYEVIKIQSISDAENSLDIIREADLILLDMILLPSDDDNLYVRYAGRDFLLKLRETYNITTPVIVFTVVTQEKELEGLDVADTIIKPVLPGILKEKIEKVLKNNES